jgi:hypothetical protein
MGSGESTEISSTEVLDAVRAERRLNNGQGQALIRYFNTALLQLPSDGDQMQCREGVTCMRVDRYDTPLNLTVNLNPVYWETEMTCIRFASQTEPTLLYYGRCWHGHSINECLEKWRNPVFSTQFRLHNNLLVFSIANEVQLPGLRFVTHMRVAPKRVIGPSVHQPILLLLSPSTGKDEEAPQQPLGEDEKACVVCLERRITTVIVPCGHAVLCVTCAGQYAKNDICPICRKQADQIIRMYHA